MHIQPYLFFDGRCEEAIGFYRAALGGDVEMLMHFKDAPDQSMVTPQSRDKVMHASVKLGDQVVFMSDGECRGSPTFGGFSLSITADSAAEAERIFGALSDGGQVRMPLGETFFASRFGMLADRFGVGWMVMVPR